MPVLIRHSPSGPSQWKSANCAVPCTFEPAGSSIVTAIDPPSPRGSQDRRRGALTRRCPLSYSTRVCSAALTSCSFEASLGWTSTIVSRRSPAMIRTSPTTTSTFAVIGSGVS